MPASFFAVAVFSSLLKLVTSRVRGRQPTDDRKWSPVPGKNFALCIAEGEVLCPAAGMSALKGVRSAP